jgi:hypothetical protein
MAWVLMLLLALSALTFLEGTLNAQPDSHVIASVGWAGYIVSSSFNHKQDIVQISGSWTVPTINASSGNGYSSTWIGIGGQEDKTLIQTGTEQDTTNGKDNYHAWYELLPGVAIQIDTFPVAPGDHISASIMLMDSVNNQWKIQLTDNTNGYRFSQNFFYNSSRTSGEWVMERPNLGDQITTLADFGAVTFSDCNIMVGMEKGAIGNFTYSVVQMTNQQYGRLASASALGSDLAGFTVTYQNSG